MTALSLVVPALSRDPWISNLAIKEASDPNARTMPRRMGLARAEPVIGRRFAPTRWLGRNDENYFTTPISRKYLSTPGWIRSTSGAAATVFAAVVSQACASFRQNAPSTPCSVRASRYATSSGKFSRTRTKLQEPTEWIGAVWFG